jgi:menaquinone-dependent protoporphyrinogen IX oxidase
MSILVAYATRYGSTREVAEVVAETRSGRLVEPRGASLPGLVS